MDTDIGSITFALYQRQLYVQQLIEDVVCIRVIANNLDLLSLYCIMSIVNHADQVLDQSQSFHPEFTHQLFGDKYELF